MFLLVDIFSKPLAEERLIFILIELGMCYVKNNKLLWLRNLLEQHQLVQGDPTCFDTAMPTTTMLDPMAHLIFKICRSDICLQIGNMYVLTC